MNVVELIVILHNILPSISDLGQHEIHNENSFGENYESSTHPVTDDDVTTQSIEKDSKEGASNEIIPLNGDDIKNLGDKVKDINPINDSSTIDPDIKPKDSTNDSESSISDGKTVESTSVEANVETIGTERSDKDLN